MCSVRRVAVIEELHGSFGELPRLVDLLSVGVCSSQMTLLLLISMINSPHKHTPSPWVQLHGVPLFMFHKHYFEMFHLNTDYFIRQCKQVLTWGQDTFMYLQHQFVKFFPRFHSFKGENEQNWCVSNTFCPHCPC